MIVAISKVVLNSVCQMTYSINISCITLFKRRIILDVFTVQAAYERKIGGTIEHFPLLDIRS